MRIAPEGWPFILAGWALAALGAWGVAMWGHGMWVVEIPLLLLEIGRAHV